MNNNRGNNRRRGRGNNRQQGGQQTNRIDSRARGNAPQLLEKYRKLAHDAHLNGDRVTEEYYLQFADHYFRVLADQRQRQDESRGPRREDRPYEYGYDAEGDGDDEGAMDRGTPYERSAERPAYDRGNGERNGSDRGNGERGGSERGNADRQGNGRGDRGQRGDRDGNRARPVEEAEPADAVAQHAPEGERSIYEPAANPFVRESGSRGMKPRRPRRGAEEDAATAGEETTSASFDSALLPPSISKAEDAPEPKVAKRRGRPPKAKAEPAVADLLAPEAAAPEAPTVEEEKPRARRTRRPKAASDGSGDALETVN